MYQALLIIIICICNYYIFVILLTFVNSRGEDVVYYVNLLFIVIIIIIVLSMHSCAELFGVCFWRREVVKEKLFRESPRPCIQSLLSGTPL